MIDKLKNKFINWLISMIYGYIRKNPEVIKTQIKTSVKLDDPYKQWFDKFVDDILWDVIIYYLEKIVEGGNTL